MDNWTPPLVMGGLTGRCWEERLYLSKGPGVGDLIMNRPCSHVRDPSPGVRGCAFADLSYASQAKAPPHRKEKALLGLYVFRASCHLEASAAWSFHWLGTCPGSCLELKAKSTTGMGTKNF